MDIKLNRAGIIERTSKEKILLIVPCYNESTRLNFTSFENDLDENVDILFADDGSRDNTVEVINRFRDKITRHHVFFAKKNGGKADVIRLAYLHARDSGFLENYQWIGFWDADLATPLSEVANFMLYRALYSPTKKAVFGSRIYRYGTVIKRSLLRHYLSRVFVTFTDLLLGIRAYDSQCGAKLFEISIAEAAFAQPFLSRWIFDLEIILRIGSETIVEVPVQNWQDMPGSKIKVARESMRVLRDLFKIRNSYLRK
jgi:dolichyl-phosphate beta-glucosyltransferase